MKPNSLIDLYFPANGAEPAQIAAAATAAGVDAVVIVADHVDDLPDLDELEQLNAGDEGPHLHRAVAVSGLGFRMALIIDGDLEDVSFDAIEASGDLALIHAAVDELDGVALPICPRQGAEGTVHRQVVPLAARSPVGVVAMVAGGSRLGRDLDIEDAGLDGRRVLAATGPFGQLADLGRYATLVPAAADRLEDIIAALNKGLGVGVELGPRVERATAATTRDGGDDDSGGGDRKKPKRRRRSRRRRSGGDDQPPA